jgi:ABC-type sugar transport system ATPase subunit
VKALQVEFRPGVLLERRRRNFGDPPLFRERARVVGFDLLQRHRHRGVCQQRLERRLGGARQFLGVAIACRRQCDGEAELGEEPIYKNISIAVLRRLARFLLKPDRERALAGEQVKALDIRPPNVEARLRAFSGGNQQKVALAKWLTHAPRILLLAEPTRGMDVGAKEDVVKIVRALRDQGIAIVVFSTEPETVLSLADRVLVMRKGEVAHEFADEAISKDRLLAAA